MDINYTKSVPGCYHIRFEFSEISNSNSSGYNGSICNNQGTLIRLKPTNPNEHINFMPKVFYSRGILNPRIDHSFTYALPLEPNKEVTILEAYNIEEKYFNAKKNSDWKSFFIYNDQPEIVYAMRKGIVVDIKDLYNSEKTSIDKYYTSKQNEILIEHNDGTLARYIGLSKESIAVKLGQTVYPHTKLGSTAMYNKKNHPIGFSVYYVKKELTRKNSQESYENRENFYAYINPNFLTYEGIQKISHGKPYVIDFNDELLRQEFTRRELKKYKKNPELFYKK